MNLNLKCKRWGVLNKRNLQGEIKYGYFMQPHNRYILIGCYVRVSRAVTVTSGSTLYVLNTLLQQRPILEGKPDTYMYESYLGRI